MMQKIFSEIENHIGSRLNLLRGQRSYIDLSKEYYESDKNIRPSLNYLLATCGDYNIALRFEVHDNLYYGVIFFKNKGDQAPKESPEIIDAFSNDAWKKLITARKGKDWWIWWKYLPANKNRRINFRHGSDCYPDLYVQAEYDKIMQEIFMEIDTQLESIKNTGVCC